MKPFLSRNPVRRTLLGLLVLSGPGDLFVEAAEGPNPAARASTGPGMEGVVYGFFDDKTGARIGRLRIERVHLEHRRQGFFRVGWRPLIVLEGVSLDIETDAAAAWPHAGRQILSALHGTAWDEFELRNVRLRLAGTPAREIVATRGRVRADGGLELTAPTVTGVEAAADAPPLCFWLAGAQAGTLTALAATNDKISKP